MLVKTFFVFRIIHYPTHLLLTRRGYYTRRHNKFVQYNLQELRMRRLEDTALCLQKLNNR